MIMAAPHPLLVALNRFGLGGRGAAALYLAGASGDPRGFVRAELDAVPATDLGPADQKSSAALAQGLFAEQAAQRQAREAAAALPPPAPDAPKAPPPPNIALDTYRTEALARFQQAARAPCGIVERLTAFWTNHFAVSAFKSPFARIEVGAFEREAIRPHVLGRFADMLKAVEQHPAMLHYLDNQLSAGPRSAVVRNNPKRGLNENLAREIMELHTLGVNGGYTQSDVASLARIITGWTYAGPVGVLAPPGTFMFIPQWHEPGPQQLLGQTFDQPGVGQGEAALAMLAKHPSTATFLATKMVRHFLADDPPPALVAKLAETFRRTEGDLGAVSRELVASDEAWTLPLGKMRTPFDFLVATVRLMGRLPEQPQRILGALNQLGQPFWSPAGPNGFPDDNAAWAAPEQVKLRLDIAFTIARQQRDPANPGDMLDEAFGPAASRATRDAVLRAESKQQGLALLLMSPEMQRR
jgi:uncharacterized protein (DUF1800 family)